MSSRLLLTTALRPAPRVVLPAATVARRHNHGGGGNGGNNNGRWSAAAAVGAAVSAAAIGGHYLLEERFKLKAEVEGAEKELVDSEHRQVANNNSHIFSRKGYTVTLVLSILQGPLVRYYQGHL